MSEVQPSRIGAAPKNLHVFIGGLHRSGTTALAQCVAAHPDVSDFRDTGVPRDEGQFLQNVFPADEVNGGPGWSGFVAESHLTEQSPLATAAAYAALREAWMAHWDAEKRVLLEKTPMNLIRSRFLQHAFPDARFVFLVRHPLVTALATQKWSKTSLASLVEHWLQCHRLAIEDARHLKAVLFVNYETLCADPVDTLAAIFRFIGLDPALAPQPRVRDENERYARLGESLPSPVDHILQKKFQRGAGYSALKNHLVRVVERLILPAIMGDDAIICRTSRELAFVERAYRSPVADMGYDISDLRGVSRSFAEVAAAGGQLS